jgi:hypothetical protein
MSGTSQSQIPRPKQDEKDPLKELLDRMDQVRGTIAGADPRLSRTIEALVAAAQQPGQVAEEEFRTRVAYALHDLGRLVGPMVSLPEPLRQEMGRLAVSAPGLRNQRLGELLRETPRIADVQLVRDIRQAAIEVARSPDQNGPDALRRVQQIEERLQQAAASPPTARRPAPAGEASSPAERVHAAASPGEGTRQPVASMPPPDLPGHQGIPQRAGAALVRGPGLLDRLASAMAPRERQPSPEGAPTPIADRILAFTRTHLDRRSLEAAETSGQRALEATGAFERGPGAGIMTRIREAAQADPRGLQGVLSEMREGGRHAELRTQFNNALQQERGFAAAYDAASSAVRRYGQDRQVAEAVILRRTGEPQLAARFERLDAQIGEATSHIPGRQEGRSLSDDLGQRVAGLTRRAAEAVRSVFSREPRASASPSPSP